MTVRTVVERRYEVLAYSAKQALIPIERLVAHWPCTVMEAGTKIVNVVPKRK